MLEVFEGMRWSNVVFTSSGTGTLDGNGATWWGLPGAGYVIHLENRPRMMRLYDSSNILFENIFFKNAPYWNFNMRNIDGLEMRHFSVDARRTTDDGHGAIDITASNTDGFDVAGRNVWIHDCSIWNQDDCIAVKDANPSENMVFERITASGLRLSIGSIGAGSHIPNITFRDVYMHKTVKGIYLKFRSGASSGRGRTIAVRNLDRTSAAVGERGSLCRAPVQHLLAEHTAGCVQRSSSHLQGHNAAQHHREQLHGVVGCDLREQHQPDAEHRL